MRPVLSLFKRTTAPAAKLVLPAAVGDAIAAASLVVRPGGEEGQVRVVCQFDGRRGFIVDDDSAAKALAGLFPELNDRQVGQAVQRLRARVRAHLQSLEMTEPAKRPWRRRY